MPGVVAEQCAAQRGQLAIYLDDDLQAVLSNAGGAQPIDPGALQSTLRTDGNRPAHYAFDYASPPKDLRLRLSPAPSRVNSDVTTVVSVREGAVAYVSKVDFEIRQAGRSQFRLVTPEWLGDDVEVQGEHIRQIRSQATGDRRTWEIELQQAARGSYCLHLVQTLPLPDDGTVPAAVIRPLDVERSRSHLVLENLTADEIAATTSRGVVPISIAAVPPGLADTIRRQAVAAYRVADDAAALVWQRRVREQETGLRASINLADLTTVIHADGHYRAAGRLQRPQPDVAVSRIGAAAAERSMVGPRLGPARASGENPPPGPDGHAGAIAENLGGRLFVQGDRDLLGLSGRAALALGASSAPRAADSQQHPRLAHAVDGALAERVPGWPGKRREQSGRGRGGVPAGGTEIVVPGRAAADGAGGQQPKQVGRANHRPREPQAKRRGLVRLFPADRPGRREERYRRPGTGPADSGGNQAAWNR